MRAEGARHPGPAHQRGSESTMQWRDDAIIIGTRRHGENHVIAEVFSREHGRWRGLVHGGAGRRRRAWLQPGNLVVADWRARVAEQLGSLSLEPVPGMQPAALALADPMALGILQAVTAALRLCPERAPYPRLFAGARMVLERLGDMDIAPALLARFELALLAELGYGLDLSRCALTGRTDDLAWVSPATGRAATREAGAPWAEKLLPLPAFLLRADATPPTPEEVAQALELTAHFLHARLFAPQRRELPRARCAMARALRMKNGDGR